MKTIIAYIMCIMQTANIQLSITCYIVILTFENQTMNGIDTLLSQSSTVP